MKKILITGANGLLGQKIIHLFENSAYQKEWELITTARGSNRFAKNKSRYFSLDIADQAAVENLILETKPDVIIHTAAMTQVDDCEKEKETCTLMNVKAVAHFINACEKYSKNTHFIHLSTDFIFDGTAGPYTEEDKPNPLSFYGESKLDAEKIVQASNLTWSIVRTILIYGIAENMSRSNIILWTKKSLEEGKTIQVVDDQWRTPTLAEDLAVGCMLVAEKRAKGIFNISGEELLTPFEMSMRTADYFGLDKSLIIKTDGSQFTQLAQRPPRTGFIIEKAKKELSYQPHSFEEGIAILEKQLKEFA